MFWKRQSPPSPRERSEVPKPVMVLLRQWDRLVEKDGILYQQTSRPDGGEEVLQLVLPDALKSLGLQLRQLHQDHSVPPNWSDSTVTAQGCPLTSSSGSRVVSVVKLQKIQGWYRIAMWATCRHLG